MLLALNMKGKTKDTQLTLKFKDVTIRIRVCHHDGKQFCGGSKQSNKCQLGRRRRRHADCH